MRPLLSVENATHFAALLIRVDNNAKIQRSKDKKVKADMIKRNLKSTIPKSMFKSLKPN